MEYLKVQSHLVTKRNLNELPIIHINGPLQKNNILKDPATLNNSQKKQPILTYGNNQQDLIHETLEVFKQIGQFSNKYSHNLNTTNRTTDNTSVVQVMKENQTYNPPTHTTIYTSNQSTNIQIKSTFYKNNQDPFGNMYQVSNDQPAESLYKQTLRPSDNKIDSNIIIHFQQLIQIVTEKLKVNMGFLSFKKAKNVSPIKFNFKQLEKQDNSSQNTKFFKQNPQLMEFMKQTKNEEKEEDQQNNKKRSQTAGGYDRRKKKHKEKSLLKVDKKAYGIYDRFNDGQIGRANSPPIGAYFKYHTPIRVTRGGQEMVFVKESYL